MDILYTIFWVIWAIGLLLILAYAAALPFGAPYVPTLKDQREQALDLIDLKKGQVFVDLGCGDGRTLMLAASRGLKAVGYEINPFLAGFAWLRTRRYGRRVKIVWGNFWRADLSSADGVFVFLIGHYMKKLDKLLLKNSQNHQIKLVSNAFEIPGKKHSKKLGPLFLYIYK